LLRAIAVESTSTFVIYYTAPLCNSQSSMHVHECDLVSLLFLLLCLIGAHAIGRRVHVENNNSRDGGVFGPGVQPAAQVLQQVRTRPPTTVRGFRPLAEAAQRMASWYRTAPDRDKQFRTNKRFKTPVRMRADPVASLMSRRGIVQTASALASVALPSRTVSAAVPGLPCVPGVTAERCLGSFWESGKLYRKDETKLSPPSVEEYTQLIQELKGVRETLRQKGAMGVRQAGAAAADARKVAREVGALICRALVEDERYDAEQRLKVFIATLDDVDAAALKEPEDLQGSVGTIAEFTQAGFYLARALKELDSFLDNLPASPTALN